MKIGIMQPYFFPYIGYWQLINIVDKFVVYDNIKFTKKGWIRRNKIMVNGKEKIFSLPIEKDSDYLDVRDRKLSETFKKDRNKLLNQINMAYKKAPQFEKVFTLIEECINFDNNNLFDYIYNSITEVMRYLNIDTEIVISSNIDMDHSMNNKYRVMATCKALGGDIYINPRGGTELYNKEEFSQNGIDLRFVYSNEIKYKQFNNLFIPNLSIIDVMFFNSKYELNKILSLCNCI